jgi:hypothetical protein
MKVQLHLPESLPQEKKASARVWGVRRVAVADEARWALRELARSRIEMRGWSLNVVEVHEHESSVGSSVTVPPASEAYREMLRLREEGAIRCLCHS